ncbi:ankyrin repeat domain protein-like protein, partial [Dinothrombium tinctorium]
YENYDLNVVDTGGNSLILYAANDGNLFLIELLIDLGDEFIHERRPEKVHCDLLHIAAKRGHFEVIKFFVRKGANVNAVDNVWTFLFQSGPSSSLNCFEPSYFVRVDPILITITSECVSSEKRSLT